MKQQRNAEYDDAIAKEATDVLFNGIARTLRIGGVKDGIAVTHLTRAIFTELFITNRYRIPIRIVYGEHRPEPEGYISAIQAAMLKEANRRTFLQHRVSDELHEGDVH